MTRDNLRFNYRGRSVFVETAESLKKEDIVFQNHQLTLQTMSFGISDKFTLHTGMEMATLFSGNPLFYVTPKFQLSQSGNFSFAAGSTWIFILNTDNRGLGGSFFGVASLSGKKIFSIGVGLPFVSDRVGNSVFIQLSNVYALSEKLGLAAEFIRTPNLSRLIGDFTDEFVLGNVMFRYKWNNGRVDAGAYLAGAFTVFFSWSKPCSNA